MDKAHTAIVIGMLLVFLPQTTAGQTAAEIRAEIADHNAQIEALNAEIEKYERELDAIGEKKQTLQNTLDQLNLQRKKLAASISVTKNRIGSLQLEIRNLSNDIGSKEDSIAVERSGLSETLRSLNEHERRSFAFAILGSNDLTAFWNDMDVIYTLQEAVRDDIATLSAQKTSLTETKTATEAKRAELVRQQNKLLNEQGSLDATRKAQNELLQQTKSQESAYQKILADKQAEKEAFENALFELANQLEYTLDPSKVPPAGKGVLRWPLDNVYVTQYFGKTSASGRLYASGTHNGMDFRASIGTPVKAALTGTVVEVNHGAVAYCQYGKWVLVKHANGLTTLYAHLSDINVYKGENVTTGEVIGYAGNTGYATGPHLHFTVYLSDAVSFKNYRCKSGKTAYIPVAPVAGYLDPLEYL